MTTEQALRRLRILGLTKDDEPIARALAYMEQNLKQPFPTVFHEKKHDSKTYGDLMLAKWIRLFDSESEAAFVIANKWANIIRSAFQEGVYSKESYVSAYEAELTKLNPKAGCLADFTVFYQLALLPGLLEREIESAAIELLTAYDSAPDKLEFVARWLLDNRDDDGMWDMGAAVKDGIYFPLSDSWRKTEDRRRDCTTRIEKLLKRVTAHSRDFSRE